MVVLISIFFGILLFLVFLLGIEYMRRRSAVSQRVRSIGAPEKGVVVGKVSPLERLMMVVRRIAPYFANLRRQGDLTLRMQRANLPLMGAEFMAILLLCGMGAFLYTLLLTFEVFTSTIVAGAVVLAGWLYTDIRISRRQKAFTNQLGDTLNMAANAMRTGFSFLQAIELISREMEDPMGTEFSYVLKEVQLGTPLEVSLENMSRRVQSADFDLLVTALLIQRKVGGSLSTILDNIAGTIAERIRIRREVYSLTSQGRFSGYILGALPFVIGVYMHFVNPKFMEPLFTEEIGRMAMAAGIVSEIIGYLVIQKIVNIRL